MAKTLTLKWETEALLLEVTELIKQLKADHEGEKALELEKQRRNKLGVKTDCMSLWRLQELLAVMQNSTDIETKNICNFSVSSLPRLKIQIRL